MLVTDAAGAAKLTAKTAGARPATLESIAVADDTVAGCGAFPLAELTSSGGDPIENASSRADDPAMLFYTSGTTGPAKGALHAHRVLIGHLPGFQMVFDLAPHPGDVFWTPLGLVLDGLSRGGRLARALFRASGRREAGSASRSVPPIASCPSTG